jgi:DNA-directed RNA polymerase beta' subunit
LSIEQVAVPILVAKNLTYPEKVTRYNIEKLRRLVENGTEVWPGANYVIKNGSDFKLFLKFGDRRRTAENLQIGDVVERHLEDNDIVLFNRQPSLHKLSILSHYVCEIFRRAVYGPALTSSRLKFVHGRHSVLTNVFAILITLISMVMR